MEPDRIESTAPLPEVIRLRLIAAGLVLGVLVLTIHGFTTWNRFLLLGLAVAPIGILLINRVNTWFVVTIGLFHSWLYAPGFPPALSLFYIMAMGIVPVMIANRCLDKTRPQVDGIMTPLLLALLALVFGTLAVRGFGLRALGSEQWGGATAIHLVLTILFCVCCNTIELTQRQCRWAVILYFSAGMLPSLAEAVYLLSGGSIFQQYLFIRPAGALGPENVEALQYGGGIVRFQVSKYGVFVFVLCVAIMPFRGYCRMIIAASFVIAVVFAGLSGHRDAALYLILLLPTLIILHRPRAAGYVLFLYAIAMIVFMLFLHLFGRSLPLAYQRAVSWVPFADISPEAWWSAAGTTAWRIEVWRRAWEYFPDVWLIGRGFGFLPGSVSVFQIGMSGVEEAVAAHNYHSGFLSLLIDLGILGLVAGTALLGYGCYRHIRILQQPWFSQSLLRLHRVVLASYLVDVARFFLVYGDLDTTLASLLVQMAILEALVRANRKEMSGGGHEAPAVRSYV